MSARPARVLLTSGAAALALGLLAPSAALAEGNDDAARAGAGTAANQERGKGGDPAGNNGTIKINPYGSTDGRANHPHPGCDFRLQMFNFDDDQTGTITFVGQAPTKGAVTTQPLAGTRLLSDDAAGGGKDVDAFYDVRGASLGLTGTPAKQGFHIKVMVDADDAPGGAKQKVFWLKCPATTPSGATSGTAGAPTSSTTTSAVTTEAVESGKTVSGATSGAATAETSAARAAKASRRIAAASPATAFTGGTAGAAAAATRPAGATQNRGSSLPRTGVPAFALLAIALAALAAGALAIHVGRSRTDVS